MILASVNCNYMPAEFGAAQFAQRFMDKDSCILALNTIKIADLLPGMRDRSVWPIAQTQCLEWVVFFTTMLWSTLFPGERDIPKRTQINRMSEVIF